MSVSHSLDGPRNGGTARVADRRAATQKALMIALMILVALAPLPLGSNRPVFWALGTLLLGGVGAVYFAHLARTGAALRAAPRWLGTAGLLAAIYLAWIVLQSLPLGLTGEVTLPSGARVGDLDTISLTPDASRLAAVRVAGYALIFVLMLQISVNRGRAKNCVHLIVLMVTGWAAYALLALLQLGDTILLFDKWAYFGSATGPFVNRNSFATFLAMGLIAGAGLMADRLTLPRAQDRAGPRGLLARLTDPETMRVYLAGLALLLVLATLIQTNSRMGVFAGILGTGLTVTLIAIRRGGLRLRSVLAIPAVLAAVGGGVAWIYGGLLFDRLGSLERDVDVRLSLYRQVAGMIAERPWTGWGADGFHIAYQSFRTVPVSPEFVWERTHSTYLAHWVETGVLAGSIPIVLVGWAFLACLHAALRREADIVLPAIGAGVILMGAVHSLVDFSLEMQANVWLFLALVALALGGHVRAHAGGVNAVPQALGAGAAPPPPIADPVPAAPPRIPDPIPEPPPPQPPAPRVPMPEPGAAPAPAKPARTRSRGRRPRRRP